MTLHDAATGLKNAAREREDARRYFTAASSAMARAILRAHKNGMTPTQIAADAKVSRQHVHNILKGNR